MVRLSFFSALRRGLSPILLLLVLFVPFYTDFEVLTVRGGCSGPWKGILGDYFLGVSPSIASFGVLKGEK